MKHGARRAGGMKVQGEQSNDRSTLVVNFCRCCYFLLLGVCWMLLLLFFVTGRLLERQ
jgi:hypothetical protein